MNRKIITIILTFILTFVSFSANTQVVYASDIALNIADCSTWEDVTSMYGANVSQWLKGIADSLGMTCSAFCAAVSSGAVALSPYIVGAVAIGSAAYLGYDLYTNWNTIKDQVVTELMGGSAYADYWFENYAQGIIDGTYDLEHGIEVPVDIFNSMTLTLSNVLTYDLTDTFEGKNTCVRATSNTITSTDINAWLTSLGFEGEYSVSTTIYNPIICMYNKASQDYIIFVGSSCYNDTYGDLFLCEVAGKMYAQLQNTNIVNDIGYALQPISNSGVIWNSTDASTGYTVGLSPVFDLSNLKIADGTMTYVYNGATYTLSILCPTSCSIVLGNLTYSELEYPYTYWLTKYSIVSLLPWYWQVSGISTADMSTLKEKVNTKPKAIPKEYVDVIDTAIATDTDIPLNLPISDVADYVDGVVDDTSVVTDSIPDTIVSDTPIDDVVDTPIDDVVDIPIDDVVDTPIDDTPVNTGDSLADKILGNLLDILKQFAYWLFVPSDGFLDGFLDDLTSIVEESTGILTYPIVAIINFLHRLSDIGSTDVVLTIPKLDWQGSTIFPRQSINLSALIRDNTEIQKFYNYYLIFCRGILVLFTLNLARIKEEKMTRG